MLTVLKWVGVSVAGLLGLAVAVLLIAGMRPKARMLTVTTDVRLPPDQVWNWLTDPGKVKSWVGWMQEARNRVGSDGQLGAEQVWVMQDRNNSNRKMEIVAKVTESRRPRFFRATLTAPGGFTGVNDYQLDPLPSGGTRVTMTSTYNFDQWFARLLEPLITRSAHKKALEDIARLKQVAERTAATTPVSVTEQARSVPAK